MKASPVVATRNFSPTGRSRIWNSVFGVALITGALTIAFLAVWIVLIFAFGSVWWWNEPHPLLPVAYAVLSGSSLAAFVLTYRWRRKHYQPTSYSIIFEMAAAALIGCLFIFIFIVGEQMAYNAEWAVGN